MSKTCPDRQMLSVYLDGELPSPWREKLESHVSGCPECAARIEAYKRAVPTPADEAREREAGERVWRRLGESAPRGRRPVGAIWRRSVPLPAVAAAAALAVGVAAAWAAWAPTEREADLVGFVSVSESGLYAPGQDMESVIEYLIGRGGDTLVLFELPGNLSFVSSGDPAIVGAADYSRQLASWRARERGRN